jgi:hypothetical protein
MKLDLSGMEFLKEPSKVRIALPQWNFREREPANLMEFGFVEGNGFVLVCAYYVPEGHVRVAICEANRLRNCHHQRTDDFFKANGQAQFFFDLAHNRVPWILIWLNVSSGREPTLGILVIDQEDVGTVNNHEVRNKVLRRSCGLGDPV